MKQCRTCGGEGLILDEKDKQITCPNCNGMGVSEKRSTNPHKKKSNNTNLQTEIGGE